MQFIQGIIDSLDGIIKNIVNGQILWIEVKKKCICKNPLFLFHFN